MLLKHDMARVLDNMIRQRSFSHEHLKKDQIQDFGVTEGGVPVMHKDCHGDGGGHGHGHVDGR